MYILGRFRATYFECFTVRSRWTVTSIASEGIVVVYITRDIVMNVNHGPFVEGHMT
jgi:hypothetical protein